MQLKEKLEILGTLDKQIMDLVTEEELASAETEETDEDECLKEIKECGSVQEKINMALLTIQEKLATKEQRTGLRRSDSHISQNSLSSTSSQTHKVRPKLPKLDLSKYLRRPQDWHDFWDGFVSAVHRNKELSTVDPSRPLEMEMLHSTAQGTQAYYQCGQMRTLTFISWPLTRDLPHAPARHHIFAATLFLSVDLPVTSSVAHIVFP